MIIYKAFCGMLLMVFSNQITYPGEEMNMIQSGIQLSSLGQNRDPMPATKLHDLNDRKQLELMERTGYEIVQRNGMYDLIVRS